jgi:hypothetical protein
MAAMTALFFGVDECDRYSAGVHFQHVAAPNTYNHEQVFPHLLHISRGAVIQPEGTRTSRTV